MGRAAGVGAGRLARSCGCCPSDTEKYGEREVTLATVLPMAWPALTKPDGRIFLGLQRSTQSGDVNRDMALVLLLALEAPPGGPVDRAALPGSGPRLADVLEPEPLEVTRAGGVRLLAGRGVDRP